VASRTRARKGDRRWLFVAANRAAAGALELFARVLPALPERAAVRLADAIATLLYACDGRGRRTGRQGLKAVFGEEMTSADRRRVLRASYRTTVRSIVLLFHLQPMTPQRFARYVRVTPEDEERFRAAREAGLTYVAASGHFGNWELLLASRAALPYAPESNYLVESTGWPGVDAVFRRLRAHDGRTGALQRGGSSTLAAGLRRGRCAGLLVDRNVPKRYGGVFVPFLGIPARTTPLPAKLAYWNGVPLVVMLLLPEGELRWRLWVSGDLMPRTGDEEHDIAVGLARMNDVLSRAIREHPESWAWMLKRWKSRPSPELGPYPPYSLFEE
jgi:Kdo2-lipid IVA lauroyltransferase/acyltransferase